MKRVLLTGASGFVGRHAIAPLRARGYEVHAVGKGSAEGAREGVQWHAADLLDPVAAAQVLDRAGATHLLHFAWYTAHGRFWDADENDDWVRASLALVRGFRERGGVRAVIAGTCAEYGADARPCSESATPLEPAQRYGRAKLALYRAFGAYCDESGLSGGWGRIFFLYGPGEHPDRLLPSVVRALAAGERARCSHGLQVRDFLHVADVADAFAALLDADVEGAVNIASGVPATVRELALAAGHELGAADRIDFGARAATPGEPPVLVADVTRLRSEVGWRPRYDLREGVRAALATPHDEAAR